MAKRSINAGKPLKGASLSLNPGTSPSTSLLQSLAAEGESIRNIRPRPKNSFVLSEFLAANPGLTEAVAVRRLRALVKAGKLVKVRISVINAAGVLGGFVGYQPAEDHADENQAE